MLWTPLDSPKKLSSTRLKVLTMAQELKSINLVAPAFKGINTEDSPLAQDPSFAETRTTPVIDKRGRIAARKGLTVHTTDKD